MRKLIFLLAFVGLFSCSFTVDAQTFRNASGCSMDVKFYFRNTTSCTFLGGYLQTVPSLTSYT